MMERLIRKFGVDVITELTPEEHHKLVHGIKKQREKAKRRGKDATDQDHDDEDGLQEELHENRAAHDQKKRAAPGGEKGHQQPKQKFDELMKDSESEGEGGDEHDYYPAQLKEQLAGKLAAKKGKQGTWLREDMGDNMEEDEVLDFLDRNAISRVVCEFFPLLFFFSFIVLCSHRSLLMAYSDETSGTEEKEGLGDPLCR